MCIPKREGCLGFRELELFNQVLIGKKYMYFQNPDCLLRQVLKRNTSLNTTILRHWIKCNVDGSFIDENTLIRAWWLICDINGAYKGTRKTVGKRVKNTLEHEF